MHNAMHAPNMGICMINLRKNSYKTLEKVTLNSTTLKDFLPNGFKDEQERDLLISFTICVFNLCIYVPCLKWFHRHVVLVMITSQI